MKLLIVFILLLSTSFCQTEKRDDKIFVASWNIENLFDVIDDPNKNDEDFTPEGYKEWTVERVNEKMENLSEVIALMNNRKGPDILGFMEVEHKYLIDSLITKYFPERNYKVVGYESPDRRGIDNYLLFDADKFELLDYTAIEVKFYSEHYVTRDILHVSLAFDKELIDVFVNHWPSRRGGEETSQPRRINAASTLMQYIDSLNAVRAVPSYIIMGDFNDEPSNYSIQKIIEAGEINSEKLLFNLAWDFYKEGEGTHLYQKDFNMLDQIIVSSSFFNGEDLEYIDNSFAIFRDESFIYTEGKKEGAIIPSFAEGKYIGGFADHLPVKAEFEKK